tara:strand:+ start:166 stop:489 length:324 start_codon:yes stop_codon:yes gene_type:complete
VKIFVKKLLSLSLLFCFLTSIFHFHSHGHHFDETSSEKLIDQKNDGDYYFSNECDKCLTKNNKLELLYSTVESFNNFPTLSKNKTENFTNYSIHFNIYSRPPPSITS